MVCYSNDTYILFYVQGGILGRYFHESFASQIGTILGKLGFFSAMYQRIIPKRKSWF